MALDRLGSNAIADLAVSAADIAAGTITTAKIADGAITQAKTTGIGGGGKNVIENGEMSIAQRGTSFASVGNVYTLDRFEFYKQNSGAAFTVTQNNVTDLAGFSYSLKVDCTTADTSLAANEQGYVSHKMFGRNLQRFAKGHGSDALTMTLSFYVKTNKTGLYTVSLFDRDNSRKVNGSYTVADANWARYSITFPADASGKLDNDNNSSLELFFNLYAGADTNTGTLSETWAASADAGSTTGQVNFADDVANNWEITGIQLETGSTASPFEHRLYSDHLYACQYYFIRRMCDASGDYPGAIVGWHSVSNYFNGVTQFEREMRVTPTLVTSGSFRSQGHVDSGNASGTLTIQNASNQACRLNGSGMSYSSTNGVSAILQSSGGSDYYIDFVAEL